MAGTETGRKKREFNGYVLAMSCRARPVVIGLDYISNSLSLAKINQQYYPGRGEIALKCHYLLSVERSEPVAEAMYSCAVQDLLNNMLLSLLRRCVTFLFAFFLSLSSGSAASRRPADVCLCHR